MPKSDCVKSHKQLNNGSLYKHTGRNSLSEDVCSPVENCDLVPSLQNSTMCHAHCSVPKCDGQLLVQGISDPINRMVTSPSSIQVNVSNVVHSSCRLFSTRVNHKLPLYVSPVPDQQAWKKDALNIDWSGLIAYVPSYGSPSQGDPESMSVQLPHNTNSPRLDRDALVVGT